MVMSAYLFYKFKEKFSLRSFTNLLTISSLMIIENGIMIILRFFVGLKLVLSQAIDHSMESGQRGSKCLQFISFTVPVVFIFSWAFIRLEAQSRSASYYGVPISLVQQYERR